MFSIYTYTSRRFCRFWICTAEIGAIWQNGMIPYMLNNPDRCFTFIFYFYILLKVKSDRIYSTNNLPRYLFCIKIKKISYHKSHQNCSMNIIKILSSFPARVSNSGSSWNSQNVKSVILTCFFRNFVNNSALSVV